MFLPGVASLEPPAEVGLRCSPSHGPRAGLVGPEHVAGFIAEALALATTRPIAGGVAARFPLDRVADAYRTLDSGVPGKVLVLPHAGHDSGA